GEGPPEFLQRPLSDLAPRAGFEPATNRLHRIPPFPTGVDYLFTVGRPTCRWRALVGRLFFRHSLVSAASLRPSSRRAWLRITVCPRHVGFPEFTRCSLTSFPVRLRYHSRSLYRLSYRGMRGL